jgi:hypothetical protein
MSVRVANNRFISLSLIAKYRQFLGGVSNIVELGKHLTLAAETAQLMWQTDAVREYGLILSNLPVKEYQLIGQYYLGWYAYCNGDDVTPSLFENIFDRSKTYKAKSLITLGALTGAKQDLESEMRYYQEALKHSDLATSIRIARAIAIVKSKEGFHKSAIRSLESVLPILKFAQPQIYYDSLNSFAVELGEVGRIEEANNICKVVLASPYVFAYPQWRETGADIARRGYKSRSSVPIIQSFSEPEKIQNVLYMPERNSAPVRLRTKPAKVLNYLDWKQKMVKDDEIPPDADEGDLYLRLMELIAQKDLTTWELRQVIDFVEKLRPKQGKN